MVGLILYISCAAGLAQGSFRALELEFQPNDNHSIPYTHNSLYNISKRAAIFVMLCIRHVSTLQCTLKSPQLPVLSCITLPQSDRP